MAPRTCAFFGPVLAVALAACGGGDPTSPGGGDGGVTNFTAVIDGVAWNAQVAPLATNPAPGWYTITAVRTTGANPLTLVLSLSNIPGPGTYPLGVGTQMIGGVADIVGPQYSYSSWVTQLNGAAGEITISTLTATQIVGTFSFAARATGASVGGGIRAVTQGVFDVPFTGSGGVALANMGSRVAASPGSGSFIASEATTTTTTFAGLPLLTIVANTYFQPDTTKGVNFWLQGITGVGTYALSGLTVPIRTIVWGWTAGNQSAGWSSVNGSGSVTVDSMTADRIIGTFTASMLANQGSASGPLAVSGSFNLGRGP